MLRTRLSLTRSLLFGSCLAGNVIIPGQRKKRSRLSDSFTYFPCAEGEFLSSFEVRLTTLTRSTLWVKDTDITSPWNSLVVSLWRHTSRHAGHKWYYWVAFIRSEYTLLHEYRECLNELERLLLLLSAVSMWQSCGRWRIHIFTGVVLCICHVCYGNAPLALPLSPLLWSTLSRFTCHFRRWAVSVRSPSASQHSAIRQDVHVRLVCQENGPTFHQQRPESQETPASNNGRKWCYLFWQITNILLIFVTLTSQSGLFIESSKALLMSNSCNLFDGMICINEVAKHLDF